MLPISIDSLDKQVRPVPTGKVKWYDADKVLGFLSQEDGEDVYVRSSALPAGVEGLKAGHVPSAWRGRSVLALYFHPAGKRAFGKIDRTSSNNAARSSAT